MSKVVLFTNSYFEYVKLKSFLEKVNASVTYHLFRHNTYANILLQTKFKVVWQNSITKNSVFCS